MQTSYKSKKSIALRGAAKGVAGALCLLSASAVGAQQAAPPIVVSSDLPPGLVPMGEANTLPAAAPTQPRTQLLVSANLKDVSVSDALSMIADQGKVGIIISGDIKETISNMILNEQTPDEAIRLVTQTAGLAWKRSGHTYVIAKSFPDDLKLPAMASTQSDASNALIGTLSVVPELTPILQPRRDEERSGLQAISIRNVSPRLMAWWINPSAQVEPAEYVGQKRIREEAAYPNEAVKRTLPPEPSGFPVLPSANYGVLPATPQPYLQSSQQIGRQGGQGGQGRQGGQGGQGNQNGGNGGGGQQIFDLPDGVDSLVAIDPLNVLLVRGTADGVRELRNVIELLDRPIPQVEIEAQFVTLSNNDRRAFGIDFFGVSNNGNTRVNTNLIPPGTDQTSLLQISRGQFTAVLQSLIAQDRAKVVNSPRITTLNNLTAQLRATSQLFIITTQSNVVPGANGTVISTTTQTINTFTTGVVLTVTPTINRDGTITIAMQPVVSVPTSIAGQTFPQIDGQTINTISNVKDGDTLAIGGLRLKANSSFDRRIPFLGSLPLVGALFRSKGKDNRESELIIFVTARIVRRTEEPVPGT